MGDSQDKDKSQTPIQPDKDGQFKRQESTFRNFISNEPGARFIPEKDRYVLYINSGCPWAHRTWITRSLKGLDDIIGIVFTSFNLGDNGWEFAGPDSHYPKDPHYGISNTKSLYLKADPDYQGRYTVPILWDLKTHTIVNNESSEIIRIFFSSFDDLLPPEYRESNKPGGGYRPSELIPSIDEMNTWIYDTINNGVYKTGFATSQEAYEKNLYSLFQSLERLDRHLADREKNGQGKYLLSDHITEADIRLYTTIARFDVAYHNIFKCNLKMIRHDFPHLDRWYRRLYYDVGSESNGGVFRKTTRFHMYKIGYMNAALRQQGIQGINKDVIIPKGPEPDILPEDE